MPMTQFPGDDLEDLEDELDQVNWELRNTATVLSIRWWSLRGRRKSIQQKYNEAFLQDMIRRREERKSKVPTGFQS
jgi:hypothetical protein